MTDKNNASGKKPRRKHNYTNELELKSLLIRIKNKNSENEFPETLNSRINRYIRVHTKLNNMKHDDIQKRKKLKHKLKEKIIELSEKTSCDDISYEHFGSIIMLMIKNILRKPQFSGYTYTDDFYSDAVYKILKYLHNFDHRLISERTNQPVNAFAYISQIIHNSVIYILNTKKKENDRLKEQVKIQNMSHSIFLANHELIDNDSLHQKYNPDTKTIEETITLKEVNGSLHEELLNLSDEIDRVQHLNVIYPSDYRISFDEYNSLKELLKGKVSIIRQKEEEKGEE